MAGILASTETSSHTPNELFAGDADIVTNVYTVAADVDLDANSVVALNDSNELVEWAPDATDGTEVAVGITCEAIDTSGGAATHPVYVGGYFNTDAINWPSGASSAEIESAFVGTNITHRALGYSG